MPARALAGFPVLVPNGQEDWLGVPDDDLHSATCGSCGGLGVDPFPWLK